MLKLPCFKSITVPKLEKTAIHHLRFRNLVKTLPIRQAVTNRLHGYEVHRCLCLLQFQAIKAL
jgi:hypothetical protein